MLILSKSYFCLGNMALRFDSIQTCQSAMECIEKHRTNYKNNMTSIFCQMLDDSS